MLLVTKNNFVDCSGDIRAVFSKISIFKFHVRSISLLTHLWINSQYNDYYFDIAKDRLSFYETFIDWESIKYEFDRFFKLYVYRQKRYLDLLKITAKSNKQKKKYISLKELYENKRKEVKNRIAYLRKTSKDREIARRNYIKNKINKLKNKLENKYGYSVIVETSINRIFVFPNKNVCEKYGGHWLKGHQGRKVCEIHKSSDSNYDTTTWNRGDEICRKMGMRLPKTSEMKELFRKLDLVIGTSYWSSGGKENDYTPWYMINPEWALNEYPTVDEYGYAISWNVRRGLEYSDYNHLEAVVCTNK